MFQLLESTEVLLATVTNRAETHGDEKKPAVSIGIVIETSNEILDLIDPTLRPTFYKSKRESEGQELLPGVDEALTVLRCNSIERVILPTKHEGWTLLVDAGIDESAPTSFGGCKADRFSVELKQGGTVTLRLSVGTSDVDAARLGLLGMHIQQSIWIQMLAPKPGDEKPKAEGKQDDAGQLFAGQHGGGDDADSEGGETDVRRHHISDDAANPFPDAPPLDSSPPPQSVTVEVSRPGTRTARGRDKTRAALEAGKAAAADPGAL